MSNKYSLLLNLSPSKFDDGYYAKLDVDRLKSLLSDFDSGKVTLDRSGKITLKGWKNVPDDGGKPYLSVKWSEPVDQPEQVQEKSESTFEDIPF
jgi:hypothetical protein